MEAGTTEDAVITEAWEPPDAAARAAFVARVRFDAAGLVPAIAQDAADGRVLMLAWMNREALEATLAEGRGIYWSRSRASLWRKGDTSGHVQALREIRLDCDGDAILLRVRQTGPACHTGRRSCFFDGVSGPVED
jgi:phosphoribosyl-AMP cyclohydrolase